LDTEKHISLFV